MIFHDSRIIFPWSTMPNFNTDKTHYCALNVVSLHLTIATYNTHDKSYNSYNSLNNVSVLDGTRGAPKFVSMIFPYHTTKHLHSTTIVLNHVRSWPVYVAEWIVNRSWPDMDSDNCGGVEVFLVWYRYFEIPWFFHDFGLFFPGLENAFFIFQVFHDFPGRWEPWQGL